jgi:hypothetical protein
VLKSTLVYPSLSTPLFSTILCSTWHRSPRALCLTDRFFQMFSYLLSSTFLECFRYTLPYTVLHCSLLESALLELLLLLIRIRIGYLFPPSYS